MQVGSAKCVHSTLNKPDQQRALAKLHPRPASRSESCASASQCGTLPRVTSIDVEFAHFLVGGKITTAAAEVCLLGDAGHVLLHEYICPDNTEYRNAKWVGGVGLGFFKCAASPATVQRRVQEMLHALQKDLMKCSKFQNGKGQARKLQDISQQFLGHTIQAGKHSAREDAHAALQLYHLHVKGDLALMSYQELVEHELRSMHFPAASDLA